MLTGERVRKQRHDDDDDELIDDEDHTARYSGPTASNSSDGNGSVILGRSTSTGARSTSSGGHDRVKSLADRNRVVLDKLSSISSAASSRIHSPAPHDRVPLTASTLRSRAVSPMPPTSNTLFPPKSSGSNAGSSPRGSYASLTSPNVRYARDREADIPSFSPRVQSSDKQIRDSEESTTPTDRERLYASQRAPPSSYTASNEGSLSGTRREGSVRVSFSRSRPEMNVDEFGMHQSPQAQYQSQSQSRQRAYSSESDDRSITPPADASRRLAVEQMSGGRGRRISINEPDVSPTKPREPLRTRAAAGTLGRQRNNIQRNSTEIIERTVAAARKSPVRTRGALPSEFRSNTEGKRSSWDSKRFSLDGRAAGISTRRDTNGSSSRPANNRDSIDWEVEQLRNGIARVGVGDNRIYEEDDDGEEEEETTPGRQPNGRPVQTIITSRPSTSGGDYVDDGPRTAPPALRQYRSNTGLITPSGSGSGTVRERGVTPVTPAVLVSAASTEHIRLMLESFAMFESNLARLEANNPGEGVSEVLQNADVVVQAAQSLNRMLRESAARALTEQIESEVEDRDSREVEIWKIAGAEFRDAVKVSDELVRSMTNLLLGVGRVVKDHGDESGRSGRISASGRMSADGARTGRMSTEGMRNGRMSADSGLRSGRMSAEGLRGNRLIEDDRRNVETRRSLDSDAWRSTSLEETTTSTGAKKREHSPEQPPAAKKPRSTAKGKKAAAKDTEPQPEVKAENNEASTSDSKPVVRRRAAATPVDPFSGYENTHLVYYDPSDGETYAALLNQTNLDGSSNNNKFYVLQLLHPKSDSASIILFTRWGRVGERGASQEKGPFPAKQAIQEFKKQFKSKSAANWEDRKTMVPKKGKYTWLERDFEAEAGSDDENQDDSSVKKEEAVEQEDEPEGPPPECTLHELVQDACRLIFNKDVMNAHLLAMKYDANKLPLGKMSRATILNGFTALKRLSEVIGDPSGDLAKELGGYKKACAELSGRYYSVIPHDFGRSKPSIIDNNDILKRELELVDSLGDMSFTASLMAPKKKIQATHELDAQLASLDLASMDVVDSKSSEFAALLRYSQETYNGIGSCYSNGGRAPVTGYEFGKGVYFGDVRLIFVHFRAKDHIDHCIEQSLFQMLAISANYTHCYQSTGMGLLLLCETVTKPYHEEYGFNFHADKTSKENGKVATKAMGKLQHPNWKDAGDTLGRPEMAGVMMPAGKAEDVSSTFPTPTVKVEDNWNEYIVYDVAQIRTRYLLMVQFTYGNDEVLFPGGDEVCTIAIAVSTMPTDPFDTAELATHTHTCAGRTHVLALTPTPIHQTQLPTHDQPS
ncbi:unnamed protein product [Rhizoctonia solani]|uniref:NAD(+) ADP-ribosyltransferase n=1 Tax=Rhizoctonia solani TaxID=456999 RepID=A0A8H3BJ83_9AGAM|nr:unnamed protein product [Rhizoctonia solani]